MKNPTAVKYGMLTLYKLVKFVTDNPDKFPKGMKTPIYSGDLECNYTHHFHLPEVYKDNETNENAVCLGFEMWEGQE